MKFEDFAPELQTKIGSCASLSDLQSLLSGEGFELSGDLLKAIGTGLASTVEGIAKLPIMSVLAEHVDLPEEPEEIGGGGFGGTSGGAF